MMNGFEMLEKMEAISPEFVEEAGNSFQKEKTKKRGRIIPFYIAGLAAGFVLMLVSSGIIILGTQPVGTNIGEPQEWAATVISESGSIPLILLIIALAVIALFAILLIRRKKSDG